MEGAARVTTSAGLRPDTSTQRRVAAPVHTVGFRSRKRGEIGRFGQPSMHSVSENTVRAEIARLGQL